MYTLSLEDTIRIDSSVKDLLLSVETESNGDPKLPISLSKILKTFSISLKTGVFKDSKISGLFNRKDNSIYVSKTDPYPRKAFTIAHELGHYFLHESKPSEIFYRRQMVVLDNETQKDEAEANYFAASLLIPEELLYKYWDITKNIGKLSMLFGVSASAMYYRVKNLNLIN